MFRLSKDFFGNPTPPELYLCNTGRKIIGQLPAYDLSGTFKWHSYSEIQFSVDRVYTDVLSGESVVNPLFDKVEGLRNVYLKNIGYFTLQDSDATYSDKDTKQMSAFSLEYATAGSKYLDNFRINTGDIDSKEVIYESSQYGDGATADQMYKPARYDSWDSAATYYHRVYTDNDNYDYEQIQISDETAYKTHFGEDMHPEDVLYIHGYANVQFYDPHTTELSLLHLIFEKIPEWKIGHVDYSLRSKERKFDEEHIAVYDFLMNNVSDTFRAVVEWDSINGVVNFYEEAEDGINEDGTIQTRWETDVFISRSNLASEVSISYSTDDIKTKLKVSGSDDLDIREVNLGKNYILNLDYYHDEEWMEKELVEAYDDYLEAVEEYSPQYKTAMQNWVSAYNEWDNIMNAVPAEGNVVLVGDEFKKLYCIYGLYNSVKEFTEDTTYYVMREDGSMAEANPQPTSENFKDKIYYIKGDYAAKESELIKKLTLYLVNEDIKANQQDNILLRLKNNANDVATIRIYNASTESKDEDKKKNPVYKIQTLIVRAATGLTDDIANRERDLSDWINGDLRVGNTANDGMSFLDGFKINYIGTMGAYFVLAKDERNVENLEDYGVNLLREKQDTYTTIFQTQTEAMYSQEKYQCTASDEPPVEPVSEGTRWFDTDSTTPTLYKRTNAATDASFTDRWVTVNTDATSADLKNYQRYIDNYDKLVAVQAVLLRKEREAAYWLDGYEVTDRVIHYQDGAGDNAFYSAADAFFRNDSDAKDAVIITRKSFDTDLIPLYTFTTTKATGTFAVYLVGTTPYVAYAESQGVYMAKMNAISNLVEFENFFTKEQWSELSPLIREDEYTNDNFLLTGYESEEERLKICEELMEDAAKELKTLAQPKLEFSMTMANILALPEFEPIISQFALGNFIRIELRPGIVKRARLLEVNLNFDDLSDFSASFGNLVETLDEVDKHASLLAQAVQAGKQVAASGSEWQNAVDKSNKLEQAIANGLQDVALKVGRASGQAISWDSNGMHFRKYKDGSTTEYEPEEMAIINNALVATNDSWRTSKAAFGKYTINGETRWGPIAEYVTADTIEGKFIKGGAIQIGDENKDGGNLFIVHDDGSVEIKSNGVEKYATKSAMQVIDDAYRYRVELSYNKSTVFANTNDDCTITCTIYDNRIQQDVTSDFITKGAKFSWVRASSSDDTTWNTNHANQTTNTITIKRNDIEKNAQFSCKITIDETKLPSDEETQS